MMAKKSSKSTAPTVETISDDRPIPAEFKLNLNRTLKAIEDDKLTEQIADYILTGEDADILLTLGGNTEVAKKLALEGTVHGLPWDKVDHLRKQRCKLFMACEKAPIPAIMRLGEVFEAIARGNGQKLTPPKAWPLWFAVVLGHTLNGVSSHRENNTVWPIDQLVKCFQAAGLTEVTVLQFMLGSSSVTDLRSMGFWFYGELHQLFPGGDKFFAKHPDLVRDALKAMNTADAITALRTLKAMNYDFTPQSEMLAQYGVGSQKTLREAAEPFCQEYAEVVVPHIEKFLSEGDAGQRYESASLLYYIRGEKVLPLLQERLKVESSDRVKQGLEKLLAAPTEAASLGEVKFDLPPLEVKTGQLPLSEAAKQSIRAYFESCDKQALAHYEQELVRFNSPDKPKWMNKPGKPEPMSEKDITSLMDFVDGKKDSLPKDMRFARPFGYGKTIVDDNFAPPNAELIHIVRLSYAFGYLTGNDGDFSLSWYQHNDLDAFKALSPKLNLRELDYAVSQVGGLKKGLVLQSYLETNTRYNEFCNWAPEDIWPAFAENLELLRNSITGTLRRSGYDYYQAERRKNAYRVLGYFPQLPPGFLNLLWDIAIGESKSERPLAQKALESVPNKGKKVVVALSDGRQAVRQAAAEWIGNIGESDVIEDLKAAFKKEKQELVKGAIITALEKCGADVTEFMDRKKLVKEAEDGLKKKIPAGLAWFPFDSMPKVHWEDTGKPVDPQVLKWWIVQAVGQKSAVPGPLVRRYLKMCKPADVTALSKYIVSSWISYDTRTASPDEARERAKNDAASQWKMYSKYDYWVEQYKSEQGYQEHLFRQYSTELVGSASGERGMLALAAINTPIECVRASEQYIKKWFGNRLAQCKALVEYLSFVEHPLALQVLLGIANRFRTKAIRDLANQFVNAIAEREGWTLDQLSDRTIPDAGFVKPEGGGKATLTIDYGPRQFTVQLDDDLEPVITAEGGKVIKSLPAPGKNDDAEMAKESKKIFSDAKKQAKDVVKRQRERLYEALCVQRGWSYSDWKTYLNDHAIMGRLCVQVVWAAFEPGEEGKLLGCFRPLEDGSLTNENDDSVSYSDDTIIRVAHSAVVPKKVAAAWVQHLKDYDVQTLFDQFGRESFVLPESKAKEKELKDFEGHCLRTFQLRGKAGKLGYVRGEAEDGGWFHCYRKPFPSLLIEVEIGFTGSPLPEEDIGCALQSLSFYRMSTNENASRWNRQTLELSKIPAVLLSECYNDIKQLAAEGTGFDAEWAKKSYY
jgi:hypothetical protein